MLFRTTVETKPSEKQITYNEKTMFLGSCFAGYIGEQMKLRKMPVMTNPSGTIYNPESIFTTINNIISGKKAEINDLFNFNGEWISFNHYTDFSSENPHELLDKINAQNEKASAFLRNSSYLFITFGTARIYRLKTMGTVVSNCHKVPANNFTSELLSVEKIVNRWTSLLDALSAFNPDLRIIFTISPVRHWKDGAHGNQVSKSTLFLAVEELMKHKIKPSYFPAYEIQMDDLRDYRFYAGDMLHPSPSAVDYIWEKFSEIYFDKTTIELQSSILKITKAAEHRIMSDSKKKRKSFAEKTLKQINDITNKTDLIDFNSEIGYFTTMLK